MEFLVDKEEFIMRNKVYRQCDIERNLRIARFRPLDVLVVGLHYLRRTEGTSAHHNRAYDANPRNRKS